MPAINQIARAHGFLYLKLLASSKEPLNPGATSSAVEALKQLIARFENQKPNPSAERLYQAIACHEIATEVYHSNQDVDFFLENGILVPVMGALCQGIPMDRPFDTRDWKTSAPIYYFEGEHDPSTPMAQAQYNFASQTRSDRTFVTVKDGAHVAFTYNLSDCQGQLWNEIARGGSGLESVLAKCALGTVTVRAKPIE